MASNPQCTRCELVQQQYGRWPKISSPRRHDHRRHHHWALGGGTRSPSLPKLWRKMWHHKGVTLPLGGMRSTQSSSMRYTEPLGHTKEPPRSTMMLNSFIRSITIHFEASLWIHHKDEGGGGGEACSS
jgi:hypothetical protein